MLLAELPADDQFRLVKWIDRFRWHAAGSRDAAVDVLFEELPAQHEHELPHVGTRQVLSWIGKASWETPRPALVRAISVGLLPLISIGHVFRGQRAVGSLPVDRRTIHIDRADVDPDEATLTTQLQRPATWFGKSYMWLNTYEYAVPASEWNSRLLVITDGGTDYIIPRTTIFRCCYAPTEDIANALTHGPWAMTAQEVLYLGPELECGFETRHDQATDSYWVTLQSSIHDDYANLLALLYFDPYARACAESLYSHAIRETSGDHLRAWRANARLPVYGTPEAPLTLKIEGWPLRTTPNVEARPRFLVTSITSCSWPHYIRGIMAARTNSRQRGGELTGQYQRPPWARSRSAHPAGSDLTASSSPESSAKTSTAHARGHGFAWSHIPKPENIVKRSYKTFTGTAIGPHDDEEPTIASANSSSHSAGLPSQLHAEATTRDPVKRFDHLMEVFADLAPEVATTVVLPVAPWARTNRVSLPCWSFCRVGQREHRRGWSVIEKASGSGATFRPGIPRAAMVVHLASSIGGAYWIEIETRTTESYRSVVMSADGGLSSINIALAEILRAKGRKLESHLPRACSNHTRLIQTLRHHYEAGTEAKVSAKWVHRQLVSMGVLLGA